VSALADELDARLAGADARLARDYPGEAAGRQPVHTVYLPADRYAADALERWRLEATAVLDRHAGTADAFPMAFGLDPGLAGQVRDRVRAKLEREPVEDLRIDFEDGYGERGDDEEDLAVVTAATTLRHTVAAGEAAPFGGIRFKSLEAPTRRRGLRTLELFVATLTEEGRPLPQGFVVTLPKVTSVEQVEAMVVVCERLEQAHALAPGSLRFEIQVETPQAVLGADGTALVARMVHASARRCTGLHYGTYDYSASCGIAAEYQSMEHPVADHAKAVMQVAAAGTGVRLSDGSTNRLPVGDEAAVLAAWRLHVRLVRRSLERGFYPGWDLHPAQLPSRYVAVFAFYRQGLGAAAARLRAYVERTESGFLDEPATARALADFLVRAVDCGATDDAEVSELSGVGPQQLAVLARRA
jgi:citrate lyase beta subunit